MGPKTMKKSSIELLLPEKGRPLFRGKALLELIQYEEQHKRKNPLLTIDYLKSLILTLKGFSNLLISLSFEHKSLSSKEISLLKKLPLFVSESFYISWEIDKIWKKLSVDNATKMKYELVLKGNKPSIAYCDLKNADIDMIWTEFLKQSEISTLVNILDLTIHHLSLFLAEKQKKNSCEIDKKFIILKNKFNLPEHEINNLYLLYIIFNNNKEDISDFWNYIVEQKNCNSNQFFSFVETTFDIQPNALKYLFSKKSVLVNLGFLSHISFSDKKNDLLLYNNNNQSVSYIFKSLILPELIQALESNDNIIENFINFSTEKTLDISEWYYLNGLIDVFKNHLVHEPTKILLHGDKGCGKTSFALSLLNHSGYTSVVDFNASLESNIDFYFSETIKKNIEKKYMITSYYCKNQKNTALYIDGDNDLLKLTDFNFMPNTTMIWTINSISHIPEHTLSQFDYIYDLSDISIEKRIEYSNKLFNDSNLAIKVAQQLRNFGSIKKASRIVKSENDWKEIYPHINLERKKESHTYSFLDFNEIKHSPDFIGYDSIHKNFESILDIFNNPLHYKKLKANTPKGIILSGSPGNGKTLFVKNIAKKIKLPMIIANNESLMNNPENIKQLFLVAKNNAPCILFFDEIDSLLLDPTTHNGIDSEKQKILNSMLTHLDGINSLSGVLVIGTTNRLKHISKSAIRSGRLSEVVHINPPNHYDRYKLWEYYLKNKPCMDINIEVLSNISLGFSCSDIAEAVNQAALEAAYQSNNVITMQHLDDACQSMLWGKNNLDVLVDNNSLYKTAIHEAGHALLALKNNITVNRVTIIPKQESLGLTHLLKNEYKYTFTKKEYLDYVAILLGGIAAEYVVYGNYESGGSSDLTHVQSILQQCISQFGFSAVLGPIAAPPMHEMSQKMKEKIENESSIFAKSLFSETINWLENNKALLEQCAQELLHHKTLGSEYIDKWKATINNI